MQYSIRHVTRFVYSAPVYESVMEVRKKPLTDSQQRCHSFSLSVMPRATVFEHTDYLGNSIHHFDVPRAHTQLTITADAYVEVRQPPPLPEALSPEDWDAIDRATDETDFWDLLMPSQYVISSELSRKLARDLGVDRRRDDPLTMLLELNAGMYDVFDYVPRSTSVDSPIEEALKTRDGVCQDFAHIMIALVRDLGIPCRYVSGYLYTGSEYDDRAAEDASHAWVEAWLPGLDWVGFDPTNNILAGDRHIRIGVGRDYADVPPTQGVFKGDAESELSVGVQVKISDQFPFEEDQSLLPQIEQTVSETPIIQQQQQQQQ